MTAAQAFSCLCDEFRSSVDELQHLDDEKDIVS